MSLQKSCFLGSFLGLIEWPTDVLARFLHQLSLASDINAQRVWNQLAFCVLRDKDLVQTARRAPRPIIFEIHFDDESLINDASSMIFQIPFFQAKTACIDVDWGDGCVEEVREVASGCIKHKYDAPGDYTVRVFPCGKLVSLDHLGFKSDISEDGTATWWQPLRSIISLGSCGVRSLSWLFKWAQHVEADLTELDLRHIDDLSGMFFKATDFNQAIGKWNVSNVTNMSHIFNLATSFNKPLGKWNVSNVTDMYSMFSDAWSFNQPIGEWNVSNVTNMSYLFYGESSFNQPIGHWNVSNVTDMSAMFAQASSFNQPIDDWNVSEEADIEKLFDDASSFNQPLPRWVSANIYYVS